MAQSTAGCMQGIAMRAAKPRLGSPVKPETEPADVMESVQEGGKCASNRFCGHGEELPREEMAGEGSEGVEGRREPKPNAGDKAGGIQ